MSLSIPAAQVPNFYATHNVLEFDLVANAVPMDKDGTGPAVPADFIDLNGNHAADWNYTNGAAGEPALSIPASSFMRAMSQQSAIYADGDMALVNYCGATPWASAYYHKGSYRVEINRRPVDQGLTELAKQVKPEWVGRTDLQWAVDGTRRKFLVFVNK